MASAFRASRQPPLSQNPAYAPDATNSATGHVSGASRKAKSLGFLLYFYYLKVDDNAKLPPGSVKPLNVAI